MMGRNLRLEVQLGLIDKVLAPIKAITKGSARLADQLKASRDQVKALNDQQRDVSAYRKASIQIVKQSRVMKQLQGTLTGHQASLANARSAHERTTAAQKSARTEYNKLANALIQGKGNTAEFRTALEKARIGLHATESAFVKSQKAVKTYKDRVNQASDAVQKMAKQQNTSQSVLGELKSRLESTGISTNNLGQKARGLRAEQERLNTTLDAQRKKLAALTRVQERLGKAKQQYQRSQALAGSMATAGAGGLASGSAVLYSGSRLMAPGIDYGARMSELQAITRLQPGDERFNALKAQAREKGASTAFSATEVGDGQIFLARAGFSPEAIIASMGDILNLALANNTDLARTADIASNISSAFKIDPEIDGNITRVTDVLSGTAARANVNLEMLGDTMKYLGSAEGLGLSLEQAAGMAGLLGNIGIQGSQAGTTMRAMLNRLAAPVGTAKKSIEALGLEIADTEGNLRDIPDLLGEIARKTKDMGNVERTAHLKAIFGEEPGSGMAELINQKGIGGMDKLVQDLQQVQGENSRMATTMADNVSGDLKSLRSAWEEIGISITDTNEGPLRELIQGITNVMRSMGNWINENPVLTQQIVKTIAGLGMLMAAGGGLTIMLASILGPIVLVRYALTVLGIKSLGLVSVFKGLGHVSLWLSKALLWVGKAILFVGRALLIKSLSMAVAGFKALGAALLWAGRAALFVSRALLMNPIGLLVTGIATSALLIYQHWEPVKAFVLDLWREIHAGFQDGLIGIARLIIDFSPLGLLYRAFAAVMNYLGFELPARFSDFGAMLISGLVTGIKNNLGSVKDAITGAGEATIGWFKDKLGIHSPSRVFASLGGFTMAGLEQGLLENQSGPLSAIRDLGKQLTTAGTFNLGASGQGISMDNRPPLSAAPAGGRRTGADGQVPSMVFHIHPAAGMDEQALARLVAAEVAKLQRAAQARSRSALSDED